MRPDDSIAANAQTDCQSKFTAFVGELDAILAAHTRSATTIYDLFKQYFPIENCKIADILTIARTSQFFTGPEEQPGNYNILFKSGGAWSGFSVIMSLNKKTGSLELPFAKPNGPYP